MPTNVLNVLSEETFVSKMDAQNALLNAIALGTGGIIDSSFIENSINPVQSKVIKAVLDNKADKVQGKNLSTNDFDNTYKSKLDNIDSTPTLESTNFVTSGGIAAAINSAISNLGNIATIKGVLASIESLPDTNNNIGDIYFVGTDGLDTDNFEEYIWTANSKWELIGIAQPVIADATTSAKGIVQIGDGLEILNGVLSNVSASDVEDIKKMIYPAILLSGTSGTTYTVTKGTRTISGTIPQSGEVEVLIPELGIWTFTSGNYSEQVFIEKAMQAKTINLN